MQVLRPTVVSTTATALALTSAFGILLVIGMAFMALYGVVGDLSKAEIDIPVSFALDAAAIDATAPSLAIDRATLEKVRGQGVMRFRPPTRGYVVAAAAGVGVTLLAGLWVLFQLRAVIRTVRSGQPFVSDNARRLRRIGWAIVLFEPARWIAMYLENRHVMTHFSAAGVRFTAPLDIDVSVIVAGLIVLVVAEVFRAGTRLEQEHSLTV